MMEPPILAPVGKPKGKLDLFWDRNWKWFVPALFATGLLVATCFGALILSALKFSGAYTGALERAKASPAVIADLGSPIKAGFFVMGNVNTSGASGRAQLAIPISGPKGAATIFVDASQALGVWHFDRVIVQMAPTGERIDLSDGQGKPYKPPDDKPKPQSPVTQ
jgi:hypothetical protein